MHPLHGLHLMIDGHMERLPPAKLTRYLLIRVVELAYMRVIYGPTVFEDGENVRAFVILAESHCSLHAHKTGLPLTWHGTEGLKRPGGHADAQNRAILSTVRVFFDLFSCRAFDVNTALGVVVKTLDLHDINVQSFPRTTDATLINVAPVPA